MRYCKKILHRIDEKIASGCIVFWEYYCVKENVPGEKLGYTKVKLCKAQVSDGRTGLWNCSRRATKDGFCWQHHPDAVKKREQESQRRYEEWLKQELHRIRGYRGILAESDDQSGDK